MDLEQLRVNINASIDDGDLFKLQGVRRILPCYNCGHNMNVEDLVKLFPEQEEYIRPEYEERSRPPVIGDCTFHPCQNKEIRQGDEVLKMNCNDLIHHECFVEFLHL